MTVFSSALWVAFIAKCITLYQVESISPDEHVNKSETSNTIVRGMTRSFEEDNNYRKHHSIPEHPMITAEEANLYQNKEMLNVEDDYYRSFKFDRSIKGKHYRDGISMWIDERQIKMLSGYSIQIYIIKKGKVSSWILDPEFEKQLPVVPSGVDEIKFAWLTGGKKYFYNFEMYSFNTSVLQHPSLSIKRKGRVPRRKKEFSIRIPCSRNSSGVTAFQIELLIQNEKRELLSNTPFRILMQKHCESLDVASLCEDHCVGGGGKCAPGYVGWFCNVSLCYPKCLNGGVCSNPGHCSCPPGYNGRHCEGGICSPKCLNNGKCIQKDTCSCPNGFYGPRCEFSKCLIACINGGRCRGANRCKCKMGFSGDHCQVINKTGQISYAKRCRVRCRNGSCSKDGVCECQVGFVGQWCRRASNDEAEKRLESWV